MAERQQADGEDDEQRKQDPADPVGVVEVAARVRIVTRCEVCTQVLQHRLLLRPLLPDPPDPPKRGYLPLCRRRNPPTQGESPAGSVISPSISGITLPPTRGRPSSISASRRLGRPISSPCAITTRSHPARSAR